jgi:hypothetical protein
MRQIFRTPNFRLLNALQKWRKDSERNAAATLVKSRKTRASIWRGRTWSVEEHYRGLRFILAAPRAKESRRSLGQAGSEATPGTAALAGDPSVLELLLFALPIGGKSILILSFLQFLTDLTDSLASSQADLSEFSLAFGSHFSRPLWLVRRSNLGIPGDP